MSQKLNWNDVYQDFRKRHPRLSRMSLNYIPKSYAEILIYLKDGTKLVYNYDTRRVRFNPPSHAAFHPARISQAVL